MAHITVNLDPSLPREPISPRILGHFIEHLGKCIQDGVWMYSPTTLPLLSEPHMERVRVDLFEAMSALRPPVLRWPGGCFSDTYHWTDGIGPYEQRPTCRNKAWGGIRSVLYKIGPRDRNHFGTDEFLALCSNLKTEPYIAINIKETPEIAANWVEYTNGSATSDYGKKRSQNGHPDPYNVPLWGVGNEVFGWWEAWHAKTGGIYADRYLPFAKAMRAKDPKIKLVAVGCDKPGWNRELLQKIKGYVDFISVHKYVPTLNVFSNIFGRMPMPASPEVFHSILNSSWLFEDLVLKTAEDIIAVYGSNGLNECKIAFDEWNLWWHFCQLVRADFPPYLLRDGLWSACVLNAFIRQAKFVGMANFAQMVNTIGMILTYPDGIVLNPHYLAFKMYADAWQSRLLTWKVEGSWLVSKKYANIPAMSRPVLDVAASASEDGKHVSLFCVNKHIEDTIETSINFTGLPSNLKVDRVLGTILTHPNPFATNTRKAPTEVKLAEVNFSVKENSLTCILPAHSATALKFSIK